MLLLFGGGAHLLRIGRARCRIRHLLVAVAAQPAAQLVQPGADRRPVKPAARLFALRPRSPPEFPKHLDGEFLGARRVADDAGDHAGDLPIAGVKDRFEIERALGSFHGGNSVAACVHDTLTPAAPGL